MKTKNLTLIEAWQALLAGQCVLTKHSIYKIVYGKLSYWFVTTWRPAVGNELIDEDGLTFKIVPDPSNPQLTPLTFDEALPYLNKQGVQVKTKFGNAVQEWNLQCDLDLHSREVGKNLFDIEGYVDFALYNAVRLLILDLAERKGWAVTVAETD